MPDTSCDSPKTRIGLGLDIFESDKNSGRSAADDAPQEICIFPTEAGLYPSKPRLPPTFVETDPSPIIPLPCPLLIAIQKKPRLGPRNLPNDMSLIDFLLSPIDTDDHLQSIGPAPGLLSGRTTSGDSERQSQTVLHSAANLATSFSRCYGYSSPVTIFDALVKVSRQNARKSGRIHADCGSSIPGDGRPQHQADFSSITAYNYVYGGNQRTSGLGLGIPSGLAACPNSQRRPHGSIGAPLKPSDEQESHPVSSVNSPLSPAGCFSHHGTYSRTNSFSKQHRYPKRRLYNIPEIISPLCASPSGKLPLVPCLGATVRSPRDRPSIKRWSSHQSTLNAKFMLSPSHGMCLRTVINNEETRALSWAATQSPIQHPSPTHHPWIRPGRPRSPNHLGPPHDAMLPRVDIKASHRRPKLSNRSESYPIDTSAIISPVLIHINMPQRLHFANQRHYRAGHMLF